MRGKLALIKINLQATYKMHTKSEALHQLESKRFEYAFIKGVAALLIVIGTVVFIYFLLSTRATHEIAAKSESLDLQASGQIGDFIGGVVGTVFSLAGVILLIWTLREQRQNFHRERLESMFFEMIRFHKENVNEIKYTYHDPSLGKESGYWMTAERRKVFRVIFSDFKEAFQELAPLFELKAPAEVYAYQYLKQLSSNRTVIERKIDLFLFARIDITYLIIFFGVGEEGKEAILNITVNRYNTSFIESVIELAAMKPKKESNRWMTWRRNNTLGNNLKVWEAILEKRKDASYTSDFLNSTFFSDPGVHHYPYYPDDYNKYYGGHQFRLGHYFRHFFQSVNYIDDAISLEYHEKYKYLKILRGQLSTYEQIVFFLNSLSTLGRVWEIEKRYQADDAIEYNRQLITKYNLIKNIPYDEIVSGIKLTAFYPHITYEAFDNPEAKKARKGLAESYYW